MSAIDQQVFFQALINDGCSIDGQFQADHRSLDADVLDQRTTCAKSFQSLAELFANMNGLRQKPILFDGFNGCQGGSSERIAAEGRRV